MPNLINLPSHDEDGQLQVVVEAPRGSRAKFKYDATEQTFKFARPLCLGIAYPERNDRLIVVPSDEKRWDDATALEKRVHLELEQFFVIVV
jgi:hypothetical protein